MVKNYNKKIIWDYINGCYIENIDDLEEDYQFMIDVIRITRDKNMYNLCSEKVLNNYEFIKFIIETFKEDKNFIIKVANDYLNKLDTEDIKYKELIFILCSIMNNRDTSNESIKFHLIRSSIYGYEKFLIELVKEEEKDLFVKKEIGLGFIFILVGDLRSSYIILDYFGTNFLNEIFYEKNTLTIEELIHQKFRNKEKLENYGIKKFILDYVYNYDKFLAGYLQANIHLISDIEKEIKKALNNWDNYLIRTKDRKDDIFEQEVNNLIDKYNANFSFLEACYHLDKLGYIVPLDFSLYEFELDVIEEGRVFLNDYICIKEIKKLSQTLYSSPIIDNKINYENNNLINKQKAKILTFIPKEANHKSSNE